MGLFDIQSLFANLLGHNQQAGQPVAAPFIPPTPAVNTEAAPAARLPGMPQPEESASPEPSPMPQGAPQGGGIAGMLSGAAGAHPQGRSLGDILSIIGGTLSDVSGRTQGGASAAAQTADERIAGAQKQQQLAQLMGVAEQLGMTPREKLTFLANPEKWAEANATRLQFHDVPGGNSYGSEGDMHVAPRLLEHDGVTGTQSETGLTPTGQLPESHQEANRRAEADAKLSEESNYHRELAQYHQTMGEAAATRAAKYKTGGNGGHAGGGAAASGLPPGWRVLN